MAIARLHIKTVKIENM